MFFTRNMLVILCILAIAAVIAAFVLYYTNTSALNAGQHYRGVFI